MLDPRVEHRVVDVTGVFVAVIAVAFLVAGERGGVVPAAEVAGEEKLAALQARCAVFSDFGRPFPAAGQRAAAGDDVDDVAGEAGDVEAGAVDDIDPHDAVGGDAGKRILCAGGLRGDALRVDEHVGAALAQAALFCALSDREARRLLHHVQSGAGRIAGIEFGAVGRFGHVCADACDICGGGLRIGRAGRRHEAEADTGDHIHKTSFTQIRIPADARVNSC